MTPKHIWIFGVKASPRNGPQGRAPERGGGGRGRQLGVKGLPFRTPGPTTRTVPNFLFLPAALTPGLQLRDSSGPGSACWVSADGRSRRAARCRRGAGPVWARARLPSPAVTLCMWDGQRAGGREAPTPRARGGVFAGAGAEGEGEEAARGAGVWAGSFCIFKGSRVAFVGGRSSSRPRRAECRKSWRGSAAGSAQAGPELSRPHESPKGVV